MLAGMTNYEATLTMGLLQLIVLAVATVWNLRQEIKQLQQGRDQMTQRMNELERKLVMQGSLKFTA